LGGKGSEIYEILRMKLNAPSDLSKLLRDTLLEEEAEILSFICEKYLSPEDISKQIGKNVEGLRKVLESLYERGFVKRREIDGYTKYSARSFYHIVRIHLEEGRYEDFDLDYLHALRSYYITTRIEKTEKAIKEGALEYSSKVIPINKAIEFSHYVLPKDEAIEILEKAEVIALANCGCRTAFKNCDKPVDVCILLDEEAKELIQRGKAREITIDKAREVLNVADETGLVHLTLYLPGQKIYAICSCCPCCCHDLQALIKYGKKFFVVKSNYVASVNPDKCAGCSVCVERCYFGARKIVEGKSVIITENCYGCGLCITTCPTHASILLPRS
jgi:NAD-dependent dihydropyrimidine dehydrogenase PreA subunit